MVQKSPIKELLVSAILYLPLCFFVWFFAAELLVLPVKWMASLALTWWQPDLFNGINQQHFMFQVQTLIFPQNIQGQGSQLAVIEVAVNPMKYGYGLAVFSGLVLSVPKLKNLFKVAQIFTGFLVVCCIQANGVFWETLKSLLFSGGDTFQAISATGISHNLVAAMFQMSYLILPAVVPVVLWVILNRCFIEEITKYNKQH
ncbi:MAG: exosortase H-associated membrane protein [Marinicella sp.]